MADRAWKHVDFTPDAKGPLSGIVVLDLSRLVAGNMTSLQMADFGAEVIKVEPLPAGDPQRAWKQGGRRLEPVLPGHQPQQEEHRA